jgi:hypothetical protein
MGFYMFQTVLPTSKGALFLVLLEAAGRWGRWGSCEEEGSTLELSTSL